ncbi:putative J domain-containing protein [Smittium culicis]|nr:putative J domain-containing protein [Smittium culicis]
MTLDAEYDYYQVLGISRDSTAEQIKQAYMKKALEWHPDTCSKPNSNEMFQYLAEAYYTLSDPKRRRSYDAIFSFNSNSNSNHNSNSTSISPKNSPKKANEVFGNVFEELLRSEVENEKSTYSNLGMVSGGILGFIVANIPGAVGGAVAGRSLGAIRDKKGKSVMQVFSNLPYAHRVQILTALAAKLLIQSI